eukprot:13005277-Alexandrium_andersonii.AAC.1
MRLELSLTFPATPCEVPAQGVRNKAVRCNDWMLLDIALVASGACHLCRAPSCVSRGRRHHRLQP